MRRFLARLQAWLHPRRTDAEARREMAAHLALLEEDGAGRGLDAAAARRAALARFGSPEVARERHRETRSFAVLEQMGRDLRLAWRSLRRAPAFTLTATATLALGLGASIAIFSVVNAVLLQPMPYPDAARLVALRQMAPGAGGMVNTSDGLPLSLSMYRTYADHNRSFAAMGAWIADSVSVTGHGAPEQVRAVEISDGVLQALAVAPRLGRWLDARDEAPGRERTTMLSYSYWRQRFGGDRGIVGRSLMVDGVPRTVVGVMPRGFRVVEADADLILPLAIPRAGLHLAGFGYNGLARLKPGVSLQAADADLQRLLPLWMNSWTNGPGSDPHFYVRWRITPAVRPLKQDVVGEVAGVIWAVMAMIALLMLIAAGNVANLFLVRAEARRQELAVRAALGAGRARIAHALLLEGLLVAGAGGVFGLALAYAAVGWLSAHGPVGLPRLQEVAIGAPSVLFGLGVAVAAGLFVGLLPLWRQDANQLASALTSEGRGASAGRLSRRTRDLLTVGQIAMALALMVGAGLLLRSVLALRRVSPGFAQPRTLETFRIAIPTAMVATDAMVMRTQNALLDQLAAIPGVQHAALADELPLENYGANWDIVVRPGENVAPDSSPPVRIFSFISPGYFAAMGTPLLAGRDFTWADVYGKQKVCLISLNLARDLWGSTAAALGHRLSPSGSGDWQKVIGVVGDVRTSGLGKPAGEVVYYPALATIWGSSTGFAQREATFVLRTPRAGAASLQAQVRQAVAAVNGNLPVANYRTMEDTYARSMAVPSFVSVDFLLAAGAALALGLIGIYGVIAYEVAQRRREIGIRLALGASASEVRGLFVLHGMKLLAVGGFAGLLAAVAVAQALRILLFGIGALDPLTFTLIPVVLALTVLLASYLPACRASAISPVEALKT